MEAEKVHLSKDKITYLITAYSKALDSRSEDSILGDKFVDEALAKVDFDFNKYYVKGGEISVAIRAKHLDGWTKEFLLANPIATVLHLGCGLDSRVFRIDPPATVRWYDIDMPDVIEIRRIIYPERHDYQMIGTSVTDPHWLDQIPTDRPVLAVAEGLMAYITKEEVVGLLNRITEKFTPGEIIFDAHSKMMNKQMNRVAAKNKADFSLHWSMGDPHDLEKEVPRLKLVDSVPILALPELIERMSKGSQSKKMVGKMFAHLGFYKNLIRHCRYRF